MRSAAALALALLAGCGSGGDEGGTLNTEEIRRVSTPANSATDTKAESASIQPLRPEDLAGLAEGSASCRFMRNDQLLVVAAGGDAVARMGGELRHFVQTAPAGETGIFLEDRQVSISIGRTDSGGEAARLTVTNRRTEVQERWAGAWRCAA